MKIIHTKATKSVYKLFHRQISILFHFFIEINYKNYYYTFFQAKMSKNSLGRFPSVRTNLQRKESK